MGRIWPLTRYVLIFLATACSQSGTAKLSGDSGTSESSSGETSPSTTQSEDTISTATPSATDTASDSGDTGSSLGTGTGTGSTDGTTTTSSTDPSPDGVPEIISFAVESAIDSDAYTLEFVIYDTDADLTGGTIGLGYGDSPDAVYELPSELDTWIWDAALSEGNGILTIPIDVCADLGVDYEFQLTATDRSGKASIPAARRFTAPGTSWNFGDGGDLYSPIALGELTEYRNYLCADISGGADFDAATFSVPTPGDWQFDLTIHNPSASVILNVCPETGPCMAGTSGTDFLSLRVGLRPGDAFSVQVNEGNAISTEYTLLITPP